LFLFVFVWIIDMTELKSRRHLIYR